MRAVARAIGWIVAYVLLALMPLLIAVLGERPAPRGLLVETGAMLGLLGLGVLAMQLVISGRHRWFAGVAGQDNELQFHRQTGLFGWLLVLAHPLAMILGEREFIAYLDPREGLLRAASLYFVVLATTALVVTSLWRVQLGLQYEWWRALHAVLALLVVSAGLGHALLVDQYTAGFATKVLFVALIGAALFLLIETRLLRPWRMQRRPWEVVLAADAPGDVTRLVLKARGHDGMKFKPGQFAWLTLGPTPFSLQQHPFSMSSPATERRRLEFTARHSGDFTCSLADVEPGTTAWLEGPYGIFTIDPTSGRRAVFIAGGIGITPIMSMLRSCAARGCRQKMWLIYACDKEDEVIFGKEIDALAGEMPLEVTYVISDPSDAWTGETGYVDAKLLDRLLPEDDGEINYFVCGPPPMMDQVEPALRARGVAPARLFSERFNLV
jgi:predicted ferric reductase